MSQEQIQDLTSWWNEQSFDGKALFQLNENGEILLLANNTVKERTIATISAENAETVIANLVEKFAALTGKVKELEVEWLAAEDKIKVAEKVAHVRELLNKSEALGDFVKLSLLVHDWEHTIHALTEEHYKEKLKLAELAESLAESDQWKDTTQAFKDITDKWKQTGHIDRNRNDKLWNRIEAARRTFQERKRVHHEDETKDMLGNLDLKMELVARAEALAASEEWKKTTEAYQKLMEEWKSIGHTLSKKNEELWQRFIAAKNAFFDRKQEHSRQVAQEHELNHAAKTALIEKAEALKDSTKWNATAQAYAALMEEWKKTGRVPGERGEELWKRFTAAQNHFFEAKRKHFDEQKTSLENNYQLKKEICDRAEQIKNSTRWGETTAEMLELLEEWKKIGPTHRAHGDKLWEEFNAARKHFFARKDANRDQRKQYMEVQKAVRTEQEKNQVKHLADEIVEEEERLADFKNGSKNITPGKKAVQLRAHLENLIKEGTANLQRLKDKYAKIQEKAEEASREKVTTAETAGSESSEVQQEGS